MLSVQPILVGAIHRGNLSQARFHVVDSGRKSLRENAGALEFLDHIAQRGDEARFVTQGGVMTDDALLAQRIHDRVEQAQAHGIRQQRHGLAGATEQFGIQGIEGMHFHTQRAARSGQALAKPGGLDRVRDNDQNLRQRFGLQRLAQVLEDDFGFAMPGRGKQQARRKGVHVGKGGS